MISNRAKLAIGAAVIAIAGGGGAYAWAGAGDDEGGATGPGADRARQAALAHLGGGTANGVERDNEKGATWEVEITKSNGSTVDVRLDAAYKVVAVDSDSESDNESDDRGGEGGATGPGADRARQAALAYLGGGTANAVERDNENGATWEVEVTKSDGSTVDVDLDAAYKVVAFDSDSESGDDSESDDDDENEGLEQQGED